MTISDLATALPAAPDGGAFVVGLSGGLDSSALLHLLVSASAIRARGLRALHVHHGLQADADAWAAHCQTTCDALGVPLAIVRVQVHRHSGLGLEGAARAARHAAFANALGDGDVLVLGHHRDDQAETFLLRALRASGSDGLAAMRSSRRFACGLLWRPLLDLPRAALRDYAMRHALAWIEDPSNATDDADRNFLRNQVLPLLRTRWPHADAAFAASARLQSDTVALLEPGDLDALARVSSADPQVLRVDALQALEPPRRARVLRRWIAGLGLAPLSSAGLAWCEVACAGSASDRSPRFEWHGCGLQRWRNLLHADVLRAEFPDGFQASWDGATPILLPDGGRLELDVAPVSASPWPVTVHARRGGERIALPRRQHSHALQRVLQSRGVPPWVRAGLPLLSAADGRLLAAGDLVFSADFEHWLRETDTVLRWHRPRCA